MDKTTLILGAAAAYLFLTNNKKIWNVNDKVVDVEASLQNLKNDLATKEELEQIEAEAKAAESDISKKCYPVGFFGIISNYFTSDKYMDCGWYVKFKNTSNDNLTVHLKSLSVTILNTKQKRLNDKFIRDNITIPANSTSDWILVTQMSDKDIYGYSTVGKDIQIQYPDHRYDYWYSADASVQYSISNPYVNNGLGVEAPLWNVAGGVYGVYTGYPINIAPFKEFADYYIKYEEWYNEQYRSILGTDSYEALLEKSKTDLGALKKIRAIALKTPPFEKPQLSISTNEWWRQ